MYSVARDPSKVIAKGRGTFFCYGNQPDMMGRIMEFMKIAKKGIKGKSHDGQEDAP